MNEIIGMRAAAIAEPKAKDCRFRMENIITYLWNNLKLDEVISKIIIVWSLKPILQWN